jgi:AcrR family transcriptional regulator
VNAPDPRSRALAATVACAGRDGLSRITVEEVAREAGVSRASVYRWFPGGREQLVEEAITWEVGRFLARVDAASAGAPDFATRLEQALAVAHRLIEDHEVLQLLLDPEPRALLPQLRDSGPLAVAVIREDVARALEGETLQPGVRIDEAADFIARLFLSFVVNPGTVDFDDPVEVRGLVRSRMLAGILA